MDKGAEKIWKRLQADWDAEEATYASKAERKRELLRKVDETWGLNDEQKKQILHGLAPDIFPKE